jgi:predicted ester cyclase
MNKNMKANKAAASRFIDAFNTDDWAVVSEVVAPDFVLHHPVGGTIQLGPQGMVAVWSEFKASLPDSWHPIPVMITEGEYLANLLPTYGHFTGVPHQGVSPTGKWLEYGMVNIVRLKDGKLVEAWFGMDPVAEMQQMGAAPPFPPRQLSQNEQANIELFQQTINTTDIEFDNLTAFGDVVVAMGPPQYLEEVTTRKVEIFQASDGLLGLIHSHEFIINPSYAGDPSADTELSRAIVTRFFEDILSGHDLDVLAEIVSKNILIHPTAMPCEASYYGIPGVTAWLSEQWKAFPDLAITDYSLVAQGDIVAVRWTAQGTSEGDFLMLPPTSGTVEYTGVSMFRVEGTVIAEIWETRNTLGIMLQLNPELRRDQHAH